MSFQKPKYEVEQKVKVIGDPDALAGRIVEQFYKGEAGWSYKITSRYFDKELNEMVDGFKICGENEIEAVLEENNE